jgi:hypothetical protein
MSFKVESAKTSQTKPLIIESPWTSSTSQSFTATGHTYSEVHKDQISYSTLPETLTATGNINLSGKTLSDIYKNAYVISPDGKINHIDLKTTATTMNYFGSVVIPKGSDYSFTYPATTNGTYIVEINGKDGLAVINMPVYVNNGLPLIPDFFDLENAAWFGHQAHL